MEDIYECVLADVENRPEKGEPKLKSFMGLVLDQEDKTQLPRDQLRFVGGVLMEGGSDISSSMILAIVLALLRNTDVQDKARKESDDVVAADRSPVWFDMSKLPYINMIVKEGQRWRLILPLCFPHSLGEGELRSAPQHIHMLKLSHKATASMGKFSQRNNRYRERLGHVHGYEYLVKPGEVRPREVSRLSLPRPRVCRQRQ
jgi:hypothetical protein